MQASAECGSVNVCVLYTVARADAHHVTDDSEIILIAIINVLPVHFQVAGKHTYLSARGRINALRGKGSVRRWIPPTPQLQSDPVHR